VKLPDGSPQFEVICDFQELKVGEHWRKKLFDHLGDCNAGVVVLNDRALDTANYPWVHTEASVLRWRALSGENVPLFPLLRGAGTRDKWSTAKAWEPLAFRELQSLAHREEILADTLDPAAFDELVQELKDKADTSAASGYESLRETLKGHIETIPVKQNQLREWTDRLLKEGPEALHDLVNKNKPKDIDAVVGALEVIGPWWVDPRASCRLAAAAVKDPRLPKPQVFAVNGSQVRYTPLMYVRHACALRVTVPWKILPITGRASSQGTTAFINATVDEVRRTLIAAFPRVWPDKNATDAEIVAQLQASLDDEPSRPTFIALQPEIAADKQLAEAILAAFPPLRLILLAETREAAAAIAHAVPLEPLPDPAVEGEEHKRYNNILAMF
jgi:hypothetical protein